jgi:hypothetical protein
LGDGSKIRSWHDQWCRDVVLKEAYPDLFGIACTKDASIPTHLEFYGGSNQWNVSFARTAHDWKMDVFASFFKVLYSNEDKLRWAPKVGCLGLDPSIVSWFVVNVVASLGRVFSRPRLL